MKLKTAYLIVILLVPFVFSCQQNPSPTQIAEEIKPLIEASDLDSSLINLYQSNSYKPLWVKSRSLKNSGADYFTELDEISFDGLVRADYIPQELTDLLDGIKSTRDPILHAQLDVAISRSFLSLASDLNIGRVDPADINIEWKLERKTPTEDYHEMMLALSKGGSVGKNLEQLRPTNALYKELKDLLKTLKDDGVEETPLIPSTEGKIEIGDRHKAIPAIRKKLLLLNDFQETQDENDQVYDDQLYEEVRQFQSRHGLIDDGVIGPDFITAINYSQQDLISKIIVNMERLRWLPDFSGIDKNKVIVNIPDFNLYYMEKGDTVLASKVVVGRDYRQTPVFKSEMTYLVFSPTWTLPETILWEDAIPSIQKDRDYLLKNNMEILDKERNKVNPKTIKWEKLKAEEDFPYLIRQAPGKNNPLGGVKFMFPNDFSIYIHDSPARGLFSQDGRTFSSGCIRMETPSAFALTLLRDDDDWNEEKITEAMEQDEEQTINLKEPLDVWILYLTTWKKNGPVEVREDVYKMDRKLAQALSLPISDGFF